MISLTRVPSTPPRHEHRGSFPMLDPSGRHLAVQLLGAASKKAMMDQIQKMKRDPEIDTI